MQICLNQLFEVNQQLLYFIKVCYSLLYPIALQLNEPIRDRFQLRICCFIFRFSNVRI